jgi:hypothetical protein
MLAVVTAQGRKKPKTDEDRLTGTPVTRGVLVWSRVKAAPEMARARGRRRTRDGVDGQMSS